MYAIVNSISKFQCIFKPFVDDISPASSLVLGANYFSWTSLRRRSCWAFCLIFSMLCVVDPICIGTLFVFYLIVANSGELWSSPCMGFYFVVIWYDVIFFGYYFVVDLCLNMSISNRPCL